MAVADPVTYRGYVERLGEVAGVSVADYDGLLNMAAIIVLSAGLRLYRMVLARRSSTSRLGEVAGVSVADYDGLLNALALRHDYFASCGCTVADHGVSTMPWAPCSRDEAAALYARVIAGERLADGEVLKLQTAILLELARMNHA